MSEVDIRISPSLHPDSVKGSEDYDAETAPIFAGTLEAFDTAYKAVQSVYDARAVAEKNGAWTEENRLMMMDNLAGKKLDKVTRIFDNTRTNLEKGITFLEGELSQPVKAQAGSLTAAEIRAHVSKMDTGQRQSFIRQRIDMGDVESVSAVLGGPAYLSGLTDEMATVLLKHWHTKQQPEKAKRLKAMQSAKAMIDRRGALIFPELEKAVGGTSAKAKKVRDADEAAKKAFKDAI